MQTGALTKRGAGEKVPTPRVLSEAASRRWN